MNSIVLTYRGKAVDEADVRFINELIASHPAESRRSLSKKLCEAWNWVQPNGQLRDMVCRSLMLELHRGGHIQLPEKRCTPNNPLGGQRTRPALVAVQQGRIETTVKGLGDLSIHQVRGTRHEKLYNSLIEEHHYLGYTHPVGEQLKYIIFAGGRPLVCFAFSSAPRHIGWDEQQRKRNLQFLAYNTRFLILPWVRVPHLASHLLGRIARQISRDWQGIYHHRVYMLTTFVDTERFAGTCYKAANWVYAGLTRGVGKNSKTGKQDRSLKAVWVYPLSRDFKERLCSS